MIADQRTREVRLRRLAGRLEYRLSKSRTRDQRAADYGRYAIFDSGIDNALYHEPLPDGSPHALTLDEAEGFLTNFAIACGWRPSQ